MRSNSRRTLAACLLTVLSVIGLSAASYAQDTESTLYTFLNGNDGGAPNSPLIADASGNLYGVTYGGVGNRGTVFELSPNGAGGWNQATIYEFTAPTSGAGPSGSLVFDSAGNLYGTTAQGGILSGCFGSGCGVIYKLSPNGSGPWIETVLYAFSGTTDGAFPNGYLIFDPAGNLYGTAFSGGNTQTICDGDPGCGVVFELSPQGGSWNETVLYAFGGRNDGANPSEKLLRTSSGILASSTQYGGANHVGVVFAITPQKTGMWKESILHTFGGSPDGANGGPVVNDTAGNIYGLTYTGGNKGGGTIYKLSHNSSGWKESIIQSFDRVAEGLQPSGLTIDSTGHLYGTTLQGGTLAGNCQSRQNPNGCGIDFEFTQSQSGTWTEKVLYVFTDGADGDEPHGLLRMANGDLFGAAEFGGTAGVGTVYKLVP